MNPTSSVLGLVVIVMLYISIGLMSAAGSVYLSKLILGPKAEQIFFALFLIPVAGFYLAFTAHFGNTSAWGLEATAVLVFSMLALAGIRFPLILIVGYLSHGLWDAIHESAAVGNPILHPERTTAIPLGYGYFCATYDLLMAGYFYTRQNQWTAAWTASAATKPSKGVSTTASASS